MSNDLIEKCAEKPTWAAQRIERMEAENAELKRRVAELEEDREAWYQSYKHAAERRDEARADKAVSEIPLRSELQAAVAQIQRMRTRMGALEKLCTASRSRVAELEQRLACPMCDAEREALREHVRAETVELCQQALREMADEWDANTDSNMGVTCRLLASDLPTAVDRLKERDDG